ncbi:MAG: helix-turn-helix domain-containing protein [Clostridiales bacterium]|nr:helix-turn-helix domain-containing protein [Clostridiales bacterium]
MTKEEFVFTINSKLKLVRTEYGLTQEKMAAVLGISKKSLVESEKGRRSLLWTEAVAVASIFDNSTVLQDSLGDDFKDMVSALALQDVDVMYPSTMGGKIFWRDIKNNGRYRIQQNIISGHYRLLDAQDRRIFVSFHLYKIEEYMNGLS